MEKYRRYENILNFAAYHELHSRVKQRRERRKFSATRSGEGQNVFCPQWLEGVRLTLQEGYM